MESIKKERKKQKKCPMQSVVDVFFIQFSDPTVREYRRLVDITVVVCDGRPVSRHGGEASVDACPPGAPQACSARSMRTTAPPSPARRSRAA